MRFQLALVFASAALGYASGASVWNGAYTAAQAARGEAAYTAECSRCHQQNLSGYGGLLVGERFMNDWREDSVGSFVKIVHDTMPRNAPGSLSSKTYLDIVAYVLSRNDFPAGDQELTADNAGSIRVEAKQGPLPVPDFSLVEVYGCLTQGSDNAWIVTRASEPVRTREPNNSVADELKALESKPLGTHTFRLLDPSPVQAHPPKDHRVLVKGFLIRKPGDDKINPSALQSVSATCN